MSVEVIPATRADEPVLANLLELYAHDFSEFVSGIEVGDDGRFGYPRLRLYWEEEGRRAFLIKSEGRLAGFAFVTRGSCVSGRADVWDVAEFFVLRGHRRRGVGQAAAHVLWNTMRGAWEVRVMETNRAAAEFWARAVAAFKGAEVRPALVEVDGARWRVFSFES